MHHSHPATASGPGVPYPEWPRPLGDPRWHRSDGGSSSTAAKSRADAIALFRERKPEAHSPVSAKQQLRNANELLHTKFPTVRDHRVASLAAFFDGVNLCYTAYLQFPSQLQASEGHETMPPLYPVRVTMYLPLGTPLRGHRSWDSDIGSMNASSGSIVMSALPRATRRID